MKLITKLAATAAAITLTGLALYGWWFDYFSSIDFQDKASDKALLIGNIQSYQAVSLFLTQLRAQSLSFKLDSSTLTQDKSSRPPFDITTVTVGQFSHLGYAGELIVDFFNDRLVGLRFYPSNIIGYQQALARNGVEIPSQGNYRSGNTRVWYGTDYTGKHYIGWEDVRLAKEMDAWIKRYS